LRGSECAQAIGGATQERDITIVDTLRGIFDGVAIEHESRAYAPIAGGSCVLFESDFAARSHVVDDSNGIALYRRVRRTNGRFAGALDREAPQFHG